MGQRGVCVSTASPQWHFCLMRDNFVWIQLTERHTSKHWAEQWLFSWGGMKAWRHGWDLWTGTYQIPHVVRRSPKSTHTLHGCLIYLSHCITYTKLRGAKYRLYPRPSEVRCRCKSISQNKTFITSRVISSAQSGQGIVPSLPSLIQAQDCDRSRP